MLVKPARRPHLRAHTENDRLFVAQSTSVPPPCAHLALFLCSRASHQVIVILEGRGRRLLGVVIRHCHTRVYNKWSDRSLATDLAGFVVPRSDEHRRGMLLACVRLAGKLVAQKHRDEAAAASKRLEGPEKTSLANRIRGHEDSSKTEDWYRLCRIERA